VINFKDKGAKDSEIMSHRRASAATAREFELTFNRLAMPYLSQPLLLNMKTVPPGASCSLEDRKRQGKFAGVIEKEEFSRAETKKKLRHLRLTCEFPGR
jgi:hypothetical protein